MSPQYLGSPLSNITHKFSMLLFSDQVMSDSLRPHGLQHAGLPCPSPSPGACSNSHPLSQWCHPTISSSVVPFSSCPQSFPVSGSFPMSQFFTSGDQSIGVSASASVFPMSIQDWFPLGLTGLVSFYRYVRSCKKAVSGGIESISYNKCVLSTYYVPGTI